MPHNTSAFYHVSPEAVVLDVQTAVVVAAARRAREELVTEQMARLHAIDIVLGPVVASRETEVHQTLRDAVGECMPEPGDGVERYIRMRAVTNARLARSARQQNRGIANYNWHTDFWLDRSGERVEFRKQPLPRRAICIDRPGTRTLDGEIEAAHHIRFTAAPSSQLEPEAQMPSRTCVLTGGDDQLIRGPFGDSPELALTGSFVESSMPTEKWYEVGPDTVHDAALDIPEGGIIVTIDDVLV